MFVLQQDLLYDMWKMRCSLTYIVLQQDVLIAQLQEQHYQQYMQQVYQQQLYHQQQQYQQLQAMSGPSGPPAPASAPEGNPPGTPQQSPARQTAQIVKGMPSSEPAPTDEVYKARLVDTNGHDCQEQENSTSQQASDDELDSEHESMYSAQLN